MTGACTLRAKRRAIITFASRFYTPVTRRENKTTPLSLQPRRRELHGRPSKHEAPRPRKRSPKTTAQAQATMQAAQSRASWAIQSRSNYNRTNAHCTEGRASVSAVGRASANPIKPRNRALPRKPRKRKPPGPRKREPTTTERELR